MKRGFVLFSLFLIGLLPALALGATIDFNTFGAGTSIEGVWLDGYVAINSTNQDTIVVKPMNNAYLAYNANSDPKKVTNDKPNGCLPEDTWGFSDTTTTGFSDYTFTFAHPMNSFSFVMYDYGDWNYWNKPYHQVTLYAYDSEDNIVDSEMLSFTTDTKTTSGNSVSPKYRNYSGDMGDAGDACQAIFDEEPGQWKFNVQGSGIVRAELKFEEGTDPAMAIGLVTYELDEISCEDKNVDLIAGQHIDAGDVVVSSDGETMTVTYFTEAGWEIIETHLHVACDVKDIPQTQPNRRGLGGGNPIPGKFDYKDAFNPGVTSYTYTIELSELCCTNPVIAAHAVVKKEIVSCDEQSSVVYGVTANTAVEQGLYMIDVGYGTATFLNATNVTRSTVGPNGLAYDPVNERLYYCDYDNKVDDTTTLYFWKQGVGQVIAGSLLKDNLGNDIENVAAAAFYNGKYYFIAGDVSGPNTKTDDLYEVTLDSSTGMMIGQPTKITDISGNTHGWTFHGDMAIKDGIIYAIGLNWVNPDRSNDYEFIKVGVDGSNPSIQNLPYQHSQQIAFGSDGKLIGHDFSNGKFYELSTVDGSKLHEYALPAPKKYYTDLASGKLCVPKYKTETAWGQGTRFVEKGNWGMYFDYDLSDCYSGCEPETQGGLLTGAAITKLEAQNYWLGIISIISVVALAIVAIHGLQGRNNTKRRR